VVQRAGRRDQIERTGRERQLFRRADDESSTWRNDPPMREHRADGFQARLPSSASGG